MKISRIVTAQTLSNTFAAVYAYDDLQRMPGIVFQASAGCIQRCVGPSAASQCSYCSNDQVCWDRCAGAGRGQCVARCFGNN